MVVTTDRSMKSIAAVKRNTEATANEATTMTSQTTLPLEFCTRLRCCQPCKEVDAQKSRNAAEVVVTASRVRSGDDDIFLVCGGGASYL